MAEHLAATLMGWGALAWTALAVALIVAALLTASVAALLYWLRDCWHYRSFTHAIETRKHRAVRGR